MKKKIFFFFIILIFLFSCKKENLVERRFSALSPFTTIELNSTFDVYLSEDTGYSIKIIADKKIIGNINFNIENNVLTISNNSKSKWTTPKKNKVEIYISSKQLSKVEANETCNTKTLNPITSDDFTLILKDYANEATLELNCKKFSYWNNFPCGGKLTLSGKTDELAIWNFALMTVDAKNLMATNAHVENSSEGACMVNVLNKFEYSILGYGNIDLFGSPSEITKLQVTSTGQLKQH